MQTLTTIYVLRHGESEGNVAFETNKRVEVSINGGTPLSQRGKAQAREIANILKHIHFDAIFSSTLNRAVETAEIIALERKLAVETRATIKERSIAEYAAKHASKTYEELKEEIVADLQLLDEAGKLAYKHSDAMESAEESVTRMLTFLREIAVGYAGKTVLVVNHGNMMRSLLTKLGYGTWDELPGGAISNTGYVVLESDGIDFFIKETCGITKSTGKTRYY